MSAVITVAATGPIATKADNPALPTWARSAYAVAAEVAGHTVVLPWTLAREVPRWRGQRRTQGARASR